MAASQYFTKSSDDHLNSIKSISSWPMSASAWVKTDNTGNGGILTFYQGYDRGFGARSGINGTVVDIWCGNDTQGFNNSSGYSISINKWVNLSIVGSSDTNKKLYLDGVEVISWTTNITPPSAINLTTGSIFNYGVTSGGNLAHVHYYETALTPNEIKELMYHPGSITNGLLAYYPLTENASSVTDFKDQSINLNNINNGVLPTASNDGPPVYLPQQGTTL